MKPTFFLIGKISETQKHIAYMAAYSRVTGIIIFM